MRKVVSGLLLVLVLVLAGAGCAQRQQRRPADPVPLPSMPWPNPSARPLGDLIRTGISAGGRELVLAFEGSAQDVYGVTALWYDPSAKRLSFERRATFGWSPGEPTPNEIDRFVQLDIGGGRLVEYGSLKFPTAGVAVEIGGKHYDATLAPWSRDPAVTVFWLSRDGRPAPDGYPKIVVRDANGKVVTHHELLPPPPRQDG